MKLELFSPVSPVKVNQPFGVNGAYYQENGINIVGHNGIDFFAVHGQPVRAAHDGVCFVEVDAKSGHGVVIRTNEPREWNGQQVFFKTIYWHLMDNVPVVNGQRVRVGDVIGYADNSGLSTGDHLHFGLKPVLPGEADGAFYNLQPANGYLGAIDPSPFLNNVLAQTAGEGYALVARAKAFFARFFKGRA